MISEALPAAWVLPELKPDAVPHDAVDDDTIPDPAQFWPIAPSFVVLVAMAEPA